MRSPEGDPDNFTVLAVFDRAGNGVGRDTGLQFTYTDYVPNDEMNQKVWVEPNPYIERSGYEPLFLRTAEYVENNRELQFVNLPGSCTIRIFTLDLDLVQTLYHDDGTSRHRWDMLTRSIMPITSSIYIFTVDDGKGNRKAGKFVVIK
ncbi:hypothetical protein ACFL4Q_04490 [candidate division KSB1 bacterium]